MSDITRTIKHRKGRTRMLVYMRRKVQSPAEQRPGLQRVMSAACSAAFGKTTLGAAIKDFLEERKDRNLSENSIIMYRNALEAFARHLSQDAPIASITIDDLRSFIRSEGSKGLASKTLKIRRQCIKTFFKFLADEEFIAKDPSVRLGSIRVEEKAKDPLTADDVQAIIDKLDRMDPIQHRNMVLILLMADTGARVSELVAVEIDNIDLEERTIKIMGKGRKERYLHFCPQTKRELSRYLRRQINDIDGSNYLFANADGMPITRQAVYKMVRQAGLAAGIERVYPHRLRGSFASYYSRSGGNPFALQHEMGHSDIRTTMKYVTVQEDEVRDKHPKHSLVARITTRRRGHRSV